MEKNKKNKFLIGLSLISGLGPKKYERLLSFYGSPQKIWLAQESELKKIEGLGIKFSTGFIAHREKINLDKELDRLEQLNIECIGKDDLDYPEILKSIYDPPFILYKKGGQLPWDRPCVAIVGARKMTAYGREVAFWLGKELARQGIGVISGMAKGIDTWAHKGALQGGGLTVGVLGCGLDICYPLENKKLMSQIMAQGAVLSEFPLGVAPKPHHFPLRNRIISGLSLGTVIVEAQTKSGALITADQALEQGREVFAIPGPITSPSSKGCHSLIKQGAKLLHNIDDLLEELALPKGKTAPVINSASKKTKTSILSEEEKELLNTMSFHPMLTDEIAIQISWPIGKLKSTLTLLEIRGMVVQEAGGCFLRIK